MPSTLSVMESPGSTYVPPTETCTGLSPSTVMTGGVVSLPEDTPLAPLAALKLPSGVEVATCPTVCTRK